MLLDLPDRKCIQVGKVNNLGFEGESGPCMKVVLDIIFHLTVV